MSAAGAARTGRPSGLAAVVLVAAMGLSAAACSGTDSATGTAAPAKPATSPTDAGRAAPAPPPAQRSDPSANRTPRPTGSVAPPAALAIAAVGITSRLVPLGLTGDGSLAAPQDFGRAGWFTGGPRPGQAGPAVIAGHVDSKTGPAVFYRLRELTAGDTVKITSTTGRVTTFTVTAVGQYPKDRFPTAAVYGPVPDPELRLITCGGSFDRTRSSYRANVVVFARLAA